MKTNVLWIIESDPEVSHRPAEAIRVAAGISAWGRVNSRIYLHGAAVRILKEDRTGLCDETVLEKYLPVVLENGIPFSIEAGAVRPWNPEDLRIPYEEWNTERLASASLESRYLIHF